MDGRRVKVKICGIRRQEDVEILNGEKPDYCGFIIDFPKSHRSIDHQEVARLSQNVSQDIVTVGVFVSSPVDIVAELLETGVIQMAQLHGDEDEAYIEALRRRTDAPLIQAFQMRAIEDVQRAVASSADYVLLDNGTGTGQTFDWTLVDAFRERTERPFFLAGGLNAENISAAVASCHPYVLDISSGVETDGVKDAAKVGEVMRVLAEL